MAAALPLALDIATLERVVLRPGPEFNEDDFLEFCGEHPGLHVERTAEGDLIIMAPAGFESGFTGSETFAQLCERARKDGRGIALAAGTGIRLPDTPKKPKLSEDKAAVWRIVKEWRLSRRSYQLGIAPIC